MSHAAALTRPQLMDARMDAGVVPAGEPPVTVARLLADGSAKVAAFTPADVVAAMDDFWTAQTSMLAGTALVHSIFLWPQLQQPGAIRDPTLHAFAVGILQSTSMMRRVVEQAAIYRVMSRART